MKAIDFMVGDWIRTVDGYQRVSCVYETTLFYEKDGVEIQVFEDSNDEEYFDAIPITSEILEKNGWRFRWLWYEWRKGEAFIQTALPNCRMKNGEKEFSTDKMQYVHELQHALRICGIKKEIEL